jgi:hypothetical protein
MSYTCLNTTCAIALSKATFPVAMNCPVCQQPLQEVLETSSISESDEQLIATLPYVIAYPLKRALAEKHAWTRVNLLKDTFLNYLKYLGLISASEFFNSPLKDKKMVALFQQALAEPSFGSWNQYIRETLKYLNEKQHHFFCSDLPNYYEAIETSGKRKLYKGEIEYIDSNGDVQLKKQEATAIGMLINFRNRYLGHGLTLDETAAQQLWDEYFPMFRALLEQMQFTAHYPMFKHEHGESYRLQSSDLTMLEKGTQTPARVWMENPQGESMDILPFFVVPGEVSLGKEDKEQILAYESYTGKTIKFFSPEGTTKQTSGKILERLNLILRDKQKETPFAPETFSKEIFLSRIAEENKWMLDTLIAEKKFIPGVYVSREEIEIKLREWIGARMSIFFIAAEAGSGKTNLLVEMQRQYSGRNLPSLLIRLGRMEKDTLNAQIAHLLNIDDKLPLSAYTSLAGTQDSPTLLLLDGLNEHYQAERIWQEILELSRSFDDGSLKIVVTNRSTTKSDMERYRVSEREESLLYKDKKERESGLASHAFWLTPMNMKEMSEAWEHYGAKDKNRYKPQFTFDDLASFDRTIYNHISNPLVMRLFLETYHNKALPKKDAKYLNIWEDWLKTFSIKEQQLMEAMAAEIWNIGNNEILLDDALQHPQLHDYLINDSANAPYPRLKNLGWISRYVKDMNVCIGFTVEGALLYSMGKSIRQLTAISGIKALIEIAESEHTLKIAALENYLIEECRSGNIELIIQLIDSSELFEEISVLPIINYLKQHGTSDFVAPLMENVSESDWKVIESVIDTLDQLEMHALRNSLCNNLSTICKTQSPPLSLVITIMDEIEHPENMALAEIVERGLMIDGLEDDLKQKLQLQLAAYYTLNDHEEKALDIYDDYLSSNSEINSNRINTIATAYNGANNEAKSKELYQKAYKQYYDNNENDKSLEAMLIFNLAIHEPDILQKIKIYERALQLDLEEYGEIHTSTARSITAIANNFTRLNRLEEAKILLDRGYSILETLNCIDSEILSYFAYYHEKNDEIDIAINFCQKAIDFDFKKNGGRSSTHLDLLNRIGRLYDEKGNFTKAVYFYKLALECKTKNGIENLPYSNWEMHQNSYIGGVLYAADNFQESLRYFLNALSLFDAENGDYEIRIRILFHVAQCYYFLGEYSNSKKTIMQLCVANNQNTPIDEKIENFKLLGDNCYYLDEYEDSAVAYLHILPLIEKVEEKVKITELIAACFQEQKKFEQAIRYYQDCLDLCVGGNVGISSHRYHYFIGKIHQQQNNMAAAIEHFQIGLSINPKWFFPFQIANCMEEVHDLSSSLQYYIQAAETLKDDPEAGMDDKDTIESIQHSKRLAKELDKEDELPQWITELNI